MARLVVDTFPKTGTAWLSTTVRLSFPNNEIMWGGHRKTTLQKEPNVITTIRNPYDSASSAMVFFDFDNAGQVLDWYCRFTTQILDSSKRIFIAKFEELITEPHSIMLAYSQMFNLEKPCVTDKNLVLQETKKTHPQNLPGAETEARAKANKMVLENPLLEKANELYQAALLVANEGIKS